MSNQTEVLGAAIDALYRMHHTASTERDPLKRHQEVVGRVVRDIQRGLLDVTSKAAETYGANAAAMRMPPQEIPGYRYVGPSYESLENQRANEVYTENLRATLSAAGVTKEALAEHDRIDANESPDQEVT